jgi:hypothetical protein
MERLIKEYNIGSWLFFVAPIFTNYEEKIVFNDDSCLRLKELIIRYQTCAPTPLLIIDAEWGLAMRVEKTPQYPYAITLGALPKVKNILFMKSGNK